MPKKALAPRIPPKAGEVGFTLVEILIVVALIAVLAVGLILLFNPLQQIGKAWDARRKHDLDILKKAYEDYYNDKGCYPTATQVCYDGPFDHYEGIGSGKYLDSRSCHICSSNPPRNPDFSPYLSHLPCDPQHPQKQYLYQYDAKSGECPKWHRMYSNFSFKMDNDSITLSCYGGGCGPKKPPSPTQAYGYDYGVSSSNINIQYSNQFQCWDTNKFCNICQSLPSDHPYQDCLDNPACIDKTKIFYNRPTCVAAGGL